MIALYRVIRGVLTLLGMAGLVAMLGVVPVSASGATSSAPLMQIPSVYTPVAPVRLLDTWASGTPLSANGSMNLTVSGIDGVSAIATAVVLNVTVTHTTANSYLTIYPAGRTRPLASNLNWAAGQSVTNLTIIPTGAAGQVTLYNQSGSADVVVDLDGYFAPQSGTSMAGSYVALAPKRITDTRSGSGYPNAGKTLTSGSVLNVQVGGVGGVPSTGVGAVVVNVTVTNTTEAGYLTAYPDGASRPFVSNLEWVAGQTVANRVIVPVGANGMVSLYNYTGDTNVVVDLSGYFTNSVMAPVGASLYNPISPVRVLDTRKTGLELEPDTFLAQGMTGVDGVATDATTVVANVTAVDTTASSYLTVYPGGVTPVSSDLNWTAGEVVPNLVVARLAPDGVICFYNNSGDTNVVVDVFGYFTPA